MDTQGMLTQGLLMLGHQLPELLASLIGLALLWTSAGSSDARRWGFVGVGLSLFSVLGRLAASGFQTWLIYGREGSASALQGSFALISALHLLMNVLSATGLVIVVWALSRATRAGNARP